MKLTNYFAIVSIILASNDVVFATLRPSHVTEESHPMLASVFQVVDKIRSLSGETPPSASGQNSIAKAQPIVSTGSIGVSRDILNPVDVTAVNPLGVNTNDFFPSSGLETLVTPDAISTTHLNNVAFELLPKPAMTDTILNGGGFPRDSMSIAGLTADMMCSLCRQRGDTECIAIHCSNDGTSAIISGLGQPSLIHKERLPSVTPLKDSRKSSREGARLPAFAADMMCSLCRKRGDTKCIAIHCSKDGMLGSNFGGIDSPTLLPQVLTDTVPVLSNSFGLESQIDRHDLLQLTNIKTPAEQNIIDTEASQPPHQPSIPVKETTAPIWLMADSVLGTASGSTVHTLPRIPDGLDIVTPTIADLIQPNDVMGKPTTTNSFSLTEVHPSEITITKDAGNPDIVFIDGNVGNSLPMEDLRSKPAVGLAEMIPLPVPASPTRDINAQPLDIPTEIFLQMVRNDLPTFMKSLDKLQHMPFAKPSKTDINNTGEKIGRRQPVIHSASDVFATQKTGNTFGFPAGFEEGAVINHENDVTTTTIVPDIPRAVDMFPIVNSDKRVVDKHTLVLKDHGNGEQVAVHVGHGPIPGNVIGLMETQGQTPDATLLNTPSLDLHSLLNPLNDQRNMDVKQNTDHIQTLLNAPSLDLLSMLNPANDHQNMDVQQTSDRTHHVNDHEHSNGHAGLTENHQHAPMTVKNDMGHKQSSENAGQNTNHPHSSVMDINAMHPASGLQHDLTALNGIHVDGGITEEVSTTTPIPTINPMRKAALNKFSEHLLSGIRV